MEILGIVPYFEPYMSAFCLRTFLPMRILPLLAYICLSVTPHPVLAGETAVEPSDNGVDMLQDSTDDGDARSSETSAAAENLVDAVPAHEHDVPLADAVTTAEGLAEPLQLLGSEVAPGSSQRLAWSARVPRLTRPRACGPTRRSMPTGLAATALP